MNHTPRSLSALCAVFVFGMCALSVAQTTQDTPPPVPGPLLSGPASSAAKAFADGQYPQAAQQFDVLLKTRGSHTNLLYNAGVAWAYADEPGRAIWALERARLLAPRRADIQRNLEILRQRVRVQRMESNMRGRITEGEPSGVSTWRTLTMLRAVEWALLTCVLSVVLCVLIVVWRRMAPGVARDGVAVMAGLASVGFCLLIGACVGQTVAVQDTRVGVILDASLSLSPAPASTAQTKPHPDLYRGAIVRIQEERSDGWTSIILASDQTGWIPAKHLGVVQ